MQKSYRVQPRCQQSASTGRSMLLIDDEHEVLSCSVSAWIQRCATCRRAHIRAICCRYFGFIVCLRGRAPHINPLAATHRVTYSSWLSFPGIYDFGNLNITRYEHDANERYQQKPYAIALVDKQYAKSKFTSARNVGRDNTTTSLSQPLHSREQWQFIWRKASGGSMYLSLGRQRKFQHELLAKKLWRFRARNIASGLHEDDIHRNGDFNLKWGKAYISTLHWPTHYIFWIIRHSSLGQWTDRPHWTWCVDFLWDTSILNYK